MNLFQAIKDCKEDDAAKQVIKMTETAQPTAIWAILMHGAAWHEERTYDTPHASILVYSIHRMIEDLGHNPKILTEKPKNGMKLSKKLQELLQSTLLERLARYLAAVDHWTPEKGPTYHIRADVDSTSNLLRKYTESVRKRSQIGILESSSGLASKDDNIPLIRMTASLSAEDADNLGHCFILPYSLLTELPDSKFSYPMRAVFWHLGEYLIRKVPGKQPNKFIEDEHIKEITEPTDLAKFDTLIATAVVKYGILGHNGIFAHRISETARKGIISTPTVEWLLERLEKNIGERLLKKTDLKVSALTKSKKGVDWETKPSSISLPHSEGVREWFAENLSDYWQAMMDSKSSAFEKLLGNVSEDEIPLLRAAQYAMSAMNGTVRASHVMIYTHSVWSLYDHGLLSHDLALLQVHRMLREFLKGR